MIRREAARRAFATLCDPGGAANDTGAWRAGDGDERMAKGAGHRESDIRSRERACMKRTEWMSPVDQAASPRSTTSFGRQAGRAAT